LPDQSVTAAQVLSPGPAVPVSLWDWLARLPDRRDPRGVRFTLACVIAVAIAARLAGCDSFTAIGEWAASRPQRVLKALGCPLSRRAGSMSPRRRRRCGGWPPAGIDHDLADDLLCGWTAGLAAACEIFSPAQLQEQRRDAARKARAKAREAEKKAREAARRDRAARAKAQKKAGKACEQARKAAAAAAAASAQAVAGGRAKLPAGSAFGRVPVPAGTRCSPPASTATPPRPRAARPGRRRQSIPRRQGQTARRHPSTWVLLAPHPAERRPARRGQETNETTVIGPVIDGMDLAGVCLTVDALHSLVDLTSGCWPAAATSSS